MEALNCFNLSLSANGLYIHLLIPNVDIGPDLVDVCILSPGASPEKLL